ncbi:hypothetical protein EMPS_00956 [Entomortierella parvispora]|uniref:Pinin/SDK/MemA protein domain-containing protein n=1 Tax=Entomortierella parvispora TaxID=205924 RepID=A0A9P3H1Y9_9FUNG|nr:hypothetical protein EMPS_00956 [Entomortierella parvispora]
MANNRIVSSTIVLPESPAVHATSGTKRSFDHTRLGSSGSAKDMDTTDDHEPRRRPQGNSTATNGAENEGTSSTATATDPAGEVSSARPSDKTEKSETAEVDDRSNKRLRTSVAPEDAKRGRRMMGMILGTLTQFKKEQPKPTPVSADALASTTDSDSRPKVLNGAAGLASREAVQERVREKLRREHEIHEKIRQQTLEERQQQRALGISRPIASAPGRAGPLDRQSPWNQRHQQNNRAKWEGDYLFTETRPRLRYMPKVLNETLRQKLEEQKAKDQRIIDRRNNIAARGAITDSPDQTRTAQVDESLRLAKEKAQAVAEEEALGDVSMSMDIEADDLVVDVVPAVIETETEAVTALPAVMESDSRDTSSKDSDMKEDSTENNSATAPDQADLINISLVK